MSLQTDPQAMVRAYAKRIRQLMHADRRVALSRRGLEAPFYRITRASQWTEEINPWKEKHRLPLLEGGLLGELLYGDNPRIIDDLQVAPDDPAASYLAGQRSLMAIPHYDGGTALNMTILMRSTPNAFDRDEFPEHVWMSNLFGRATQNLVLAEELKQAYNVVDRELKLVADIQRSLLPKTIPKMPGLDVAASYQTSQWAGGDYYDFFPLSENRWGILIADVSGHGTPAAVMMAITHSIAHALPSFPDPPATMLNHVNQQLATLYTTNNEAFVTAFYGIYDPAKRTLTYASAGHNPPRLKRCEDGSIIALDGVGNLPLGVMADVVYDQYTQALRPGDQIVFYTDGITEATNPAGKMFDTDRLDEALANCHLDANGLIEAVLGAVDRFTAGEPAADDRTLLVAKVS
ncbi:PP2C family protein-serine/threonine phosphatase [Singulisphaera sp. GP187]|uniref:PP2C family protein-serine/threonine phosphatase n=1 Tax=Singulisphaera sp. GP187 TaxID=1882752 RepID=UPI0020B159BD|nr:PP2C family protein-serine/threonine phosphatase [Singulisphaera sp. GP187]